MESGPQTGEQASKVASLERELAVRLVIGAGLGSFGVALVAVGATRMMRSLRTQ